MIGGMTTARMTLREIGSSASPVRQYAKAMPQNPQTITALKKRRLEKLEEEAAIKGISAARDR
jgi:hypothetical protein